MTIKITPKSLAIMFHKIYEKESKNLGWKTQKRTQVKFSKLPLENQQLMIFVCDKIIKRLQSFGKGHDDFSHSYTIPEDDLLNLDDLDDIENDKTI